LIADRPTAALGTNNWAADGGRMDKDRCRCTNRPGKHRHRETTQNQGSDVFQPSPAVLLPF
jgi:hypothetical protein